MPFQRDGGGTEILKIYSLLVLITLSYVLIDHYKDIISLFMLDKQVYELGWNWDDIEKLAQGALAGHLLECGGQLTGGYYAHPGCYALRG